MKSYKAHDTVGQQKLSIAINLIPNLPPVPCKDYRLIVADPPWLYGLRETDPSHRGRCPYPAMTDQQILDMPIGAIGGDDSYILLWTTNNHQFLAFKCLLAWGYEHKSTFTWEKVTIAGKPHMGMGHYGRNCTEHLLVGTKGNAPSMSTLGMTNVPNIIRARRQEHSKKPEEFWVLANSLGQRLENCEKLGKLSQPSRIELFARQQRPNWDAWGAETHFSNLLV
ncbi:MT-A70 family methyltransferase [Microcoleus sp. K1-B6]|uniref:MT-A70 family methyltransferase n=1 Tax=unclassified Microcoleus TaxID=2642155 RepID=UPI002FD61942